MALHTLTNPYGADKIFDDVNTQIFDKLRSPQVWRDVNGVAIAPDQWECFGRARIGTREGRRVAEVPFYTTQGNDYRDAFINDQVAVTSFWLLDDTRADWAGQTMLGQQASIIFFVNLAKCYPDDPMSSEERLKSDLMNIMGNRILRYGLEFPGNGNRSAWEKGLNLALREFDGEVRQSLGDRADAYPYATVRLNFSLQNVTYLTTY